MDNQPETVVLGAGRFLRLVRRGRWEFVERARPVRAAFIGAVTPGGCLLVTEEYRDPVNSWVIGCPAGLVGDEPGREAELLEVAVARELVEEAGYEPSTVRRLTAGPTSPGQNAEVIEIVLAEGLRRVGPEGGSEGARIRLFEVPLADIDAWLLERERAGRLIDPKVYTVLYFLRYRAGA